jgi:AmiR/NasT family two-component response regulator
MMLLSDPAPLEPARGSDAWSGRRAVHAAAGMLMEQLDLDAMDATAVLRARAFTEGAPLPDIARAVIEGTIDLADAS